MTATTTSRAPWVLLALAIGAFGIGTTEFSPMGLLPQIAEGVGVSIPSAGLLVTAYALGVFVGAPLMTLLLARFRPRAALITLMAIFTVGNLLSAFAPDYLTLMAARLVTSLNHGAFFGLGAVVASQVVPKDKQASAVATMFMGLTIANIGGVPAAAWVGQHIGWRLSFAATASLGVVTVLALRLALPRGEIGIRPNVAQEIRVFRRPAVLLAMGTTVLGAGAMFTLYTYVAPLLGTLTHATPEFVTLALVLIGVGFTLGIGLGGKLADWSVSGAAKVLLGALALIAVVLPFLLPNPVATGVGLVLWGAAAFAIVPPVQTLVMQRAAEAPGLASSMNIGAFNMGNALGAAVGAGVIALGWGYAWIPVAGGVLALGGLALLLIGRWGAKAPETV